MAKKFFRQKVHNRKKTIIHITIIIVCVVGIVACLFIANYFNNRLPKGAKVELRDSVAIEVHGNLPEKTTFFSELENVKEEDISINFDGFDKDKVGDYEIEVKVYKKKFKITLKVVDTIAPELTVKNIAILEKASYKANDFVESCTDNSNEKCNIQFYDLATDQDGNKIDYSKYTEVGTYPIQIIAKDASGNQSAPTTVYLTIGKDESQKPVDNPKPAACKYGSDDYDTKKDILAVSVAENGCALDLNLYQDKTIVQVADTTAKNETEKLKKEFKKLQVTNDIEVNCHEKAILNLKGTGIVGYSLRIEVLETINGKQELVEMYYLKQDGSREFSTNKYNLK